MKFAQTKNNRAKMGRTAAEEVVLELIKTKCLPILIYGLEACQLNMTFQLGYPVL